MTADELRKKYLDFFASKGHTIIPSASLLPNETDASTLFTTAGMHPLVPYLLGAKHPGGTRVADVQKCVRTGDIDDVGDNRHLTFFEMMGNWSFGDYFKREAIEWSFEFLTDSKWLGLDKERLYVTVFKGEDGIPRDEESIAVWKEVFEKAGISNGVAGDDECAGEGIRIFPLGTDDNFWIAGATGPCGGDTEMFYDMRPEEGPLTGKFGDLVDTFRIMEVWNDVFMEFNKTPEGTYEKLAKPNVDTGMGVERTLAVLANKTTIFETDHFSDLFSKIEALSGLKYGNLSDERYIADGKRCWVDVRRQFRIVADHVKAATFMIADGVTPLNTGAGYVLRRLIRRAVRYGKLLGIKDDFTTEIAEIVIRDFGGFYPELKIRREIILSELRKEEEKFRKTLEKALTILNKLYPIGYKELEEGEIPPAMGLDVDPEIVFDLYQTYGFPFEMIQEELNKRDLRASEEEFLRRLKKHQDLSRTASAGMFKGGLQEQDENTAKLHTATHLLQAALRTVLGTHVSQKGSNITPERLRFDFAHAEKMTPEQIKQVEDLVNEAIRADVPVVCEELPVDEAKASGALGVFDAKYGDTVKVYTAGEFSKEICGGPHAARTGELGHFRIQKEEASSAGVRRIKAVLE
ncbi:MAG: alanine--tRNA ligase [Candidatus Moranbacteria bacterium]|nr:alanine--tRNA ligase [Candidatus Moranbacteria bacterium]